ncbi:MAG: MFS transporter [Anaerolineae bacterium]|nr:MFS transporter [Anaerolineae bacterium]
MTLLQPKQQSYSLLFQVSALTTSRTVINTGFRMIYPLLPVFARSVNVEITTLATLLTLTQLLGLTAPFIGTISERQGRKFTILLGLLTYTIGMLVVFIAPNFMGLALALLIASFGKMAFDPALQAYVGDRTPYNKRGMYLGIVELAWSGAFLIGVPAMTWLIATYNWQAPFAALSILAGFGLLAAWYLLESDKPTVVQRASFGTIFRLAVDSRIAIAGLVLGFSISAANQLVNVVFGSWIEVSFGVQLAALAAAAFVIGASELGGEGVVTFFADKFGKRRLVILGIGGNIIACLILPFTSFSLTAALVGLFFFYLTFELSLVATIPLATELSPNARAMYMTLLVSAFTFGRAVFTPLAPLLFNYGLLANVLVAIGLNLVALVAVWKFIHGK